MASPTTYNVVSRQMDSPWRCVTLRPIRKAVWLDRVKRIMQFPHAKSAIMITGAAVLLIVPTLMVIARKPAASANAPVAIRPLGHAANAESAARHVARLLLANPTPTPSPTPALVAASTAGSTAAGQPVVHHAPPPPQAPPAPPPPGVPAFSHVFVIVMENHEYSSVIGSGAAPYINSLAASYGLATNYYAASHPSLPNYLALTAGSTFGIASDCTTCFVGATNIADQVEASGRTWKAYMEDMPSPCYTGASSGNYAMKHDPFMYYNDIRTDAARCAAHVVPFTQFSADMSSGNVPNFVWITPNMCNDMHDCSVATGDSWLRGVVPSITGSAAFRNGGVLFITWDEGSSSAGCCGDSSGGQVATLVISPRAISGYRSGAAENHYGLLRTIEDAFRLAHLNAASWTSNVPLREYFR
ncbi:MAG TPA: alkaline phosphatase family protein [Candidatus Dormibacteraeota bacterium]|nr:alkaline phosphatase family protein [Candidatus Dormibacteraeota bacterium]